MTIWLDKSNIYSAAEYNKKNESSIFQKGIYYMDKYEDMFQPTFLKNTGENNCTPIPPLPADTTVTMAYVPFQQSTVTYDEMDALREGTLFPVLNKVFRGRSVKK